VLDPCSDQFSATVVAYEMLTGTRPYGEMGGEAGLRQNRATYEPLYRPPSKFSPFRRRIPPRIWRAIDEVISRGLKLDPGDRYPSRYPWLDALDDAYCELRRKARIGPWQAKLLRAIQCGLAIDFTVGPIRSSQSLVRQFQVFHTMMRRKPPKSIAAVAVALLTATVVSNVQFDGSAVMEVPLIRTNAQREAEGAVAAHVRVVRWEWGLIDFLCLPDSGRIGIRHRGHCLGPESELPLRLIDPVPTVVESPKGGHQPDTCRQPEAKPPSQPSRDHEQQKPTEAPDDDPGKLPPSASPGPIPTREVRGLADKRRRPPARRRPVRDLVHKGIGPREGRR